MRWQPQQAIAIPLFSSSLNHLAESSLYSFVVSFDDLIAETAAPILVAVSSVGYGLANSGASGMTDSALDAASGEPNKNRPLLILGGR